MQEVASAEPGADPGLRQTPGLRAGAILALVVTLAAYSSAARAPQSAVAGAATQAIDFGALVARYRMGQFDAAVREALEWSTRDLLQAAGPGAFASVEFEAATVALLVETTCESSPDYYREPIVRGAIAPRLGTLAAARRGASTVTKGQAAEAERGSGDFPRHAYLATVACLQGVRNWDLALWLSERGLRRFPDDPELLLAHGSGAEFAAWVLSRGRARTTGDMDRPTRDRWQRSVRAAARDYARVIELVPQNAEAHVRLGRLQWLQDRPDDARAALERATALAREPYLRYLAALFLGAVHERAGQGSDAAAAYEAALGITGTAQSAVFALAALEFRQGRTREARRRIESWLRSQRAGMPIDPYFLYDFGQYWLIDGYRAALRRVVGP